MGSDLFHDGVLRILGLNDGWLHKVTLLAVTVAAGDDGQVWGRLGMVQPLLYTSEGLQEENTQLLTETRW